MALVGESKAELNQLVFETSWASPERCPCGVGVIGDQIGAGL